jgi:phosphohistidine swiveling domain-containing protein
VESVDLGPPAWDQGFNDAGVITDAELHRPLIPDACNMAVFFGRAVMNVENLRMYADRLPGGSANAAEAAFTGTVRPGAVDRPDEAIRAIAAERLPGVAQRYAAEMPALLAEAHATWRRWLDGGVTPATWRVALAEGADLFRRAQRYQGMITMFVQGAYGQLGALVAELGEPGAENVVVAGSGQLDENRLLASLWDVGKGRGTLNEFLAEFGFHGPLEGSVESPSWREDPGLLAATLARYAAASQDQSPAAATARVAAARDAMLAQLRAGTSPEQRDLLDALVAQTTTLMPFRELGKAAFLRGIDLVRWAARQGGAFEHAAGRFAHADDVWFCTLGELALDPIPVDRIEISARRAERESYSDVELPPVFQGPPEPVRRAGATSPSTTSSGRAPGSVITGMGASPGRATGIVRVLHSPAEPIDDGDVVVTALTDPSWVPLFLTASAVVVDVGGPMSHAAIVAREVGIACVIGTGDGTVRLRSGDRVAVDGTTGRVEILEVAP